MGTNDKGLLERGCSAGDRGIAPRLQEDIGCAARTQVPVLITGAPDGGWEIACAIYRRSSAPKGTVAVVDCRRRGAVSSLLAYASGKEAVPEAERPSIVLLQEIQALSLCEQAEVDRRIAEMRVSGRGKEEIRIIASSSAPLFDRVCEGAFDERLFYRLNVIHMVVA